MQCVGRSRYLFVWAHTVETAHEDVSEFQGIQTMLDQAWCEFKSRIFLQTDHVDGDDRNIRVAGFGQCAADKSNVVVARQPPPVCEIRIAVLLRSYLPDITALIICPMTIRDG